MSRYSNNNNNYGHNGHNHNYGVPSPNNQYHNPNQSHSHYSAPSQTYDRHRGSNNPTSDHRHQPYNHSRDRNRDRDRDRDRDRHHRSHRPRSNDRDRDDYHRSSRHSHHRDRGYDKNDRNGRNDRNNYNRPSGGYNHGHGGGGYRGRGGGFRGNFRGGRGRGGFRGRGRGRFAPKEKYELSAINTRLLQSIRTLSLDQRGTQPLKKWIDLQTNSEYEESRFKKNAAKKVKSNGITLERPEAIKMDEIPLTARMISEKNSSKWLEGIPRINPLKPLSLTFNRMVDATTNNIQIDIDSMTVHQYTYDINKIDADMGNNDENNDNNKMDMDSKDGIKDSKIKPEIQTQMAQFVPKQLEDQYISNIEERREIYKRNKRSLKQLNPHTFDNMHIYSFSQNVPKNPIIEIKPRRKFNNNNNNENNNVTDYIITLERQFSTDSSLECSINDDENKENKENKLIKFSNIYSQCNNEFQQQGMNILNRKRFKNANYAQLHYREETFYNLQNLNEMEIWYQNGKDLLYPDLRLLSGYKSTINTNCIIKNQLKNKLITAASIHDLIKHNGLDAVNKYIVGKRAVTSYSDQIIEMQGLDLNLNLDSKFNTRAGDITYRKYYENKKDFRTNRMVQLLESQEEALVIHHKYYRRNGKRELVQISHFLPQLLYVIVPVEQHNDDTKHKLRLRSHPSVNMIIKKSMQINSILSKLTTTCVFKTQNKPIKVKAYHIETPNICFRSRGGIRRENAATFGGKIWKDVDAFWYNLRSIYNNNNNEKKRSNSKTFSIEWAVCYDRNSRSGDSGARDFKNLLSQFTRQRNFQFKVFNEPRIIGLDYTDLASIRNELRQSNYNCVVFILPNGDDGSKYKVDITRHVLFYTEPSTALSSPASPITSPRSNKIKSNNRHGNNISMDLQFLNESTIRKRSAVFNVFETVLLKSKLILYYLEPKLPSNKFKYGGGCCWMVGQKILRKKSGAHLVLLSCNRAPFTGSIAYITNHFQFISSDRDVIPQAMMEQLTMDMLKQNILKIINSAGDELLPNNIIILRHSGSDGLLKTIISKEIAGLKKACHEFSKKHRDLIQKANGGNKRWYPGIIFSVLQENVPDAFGIDGENGQIMDSPTALVVNSRITSRQYFDIFMSLPTKQERQLYSRVIRIIILQDEYVSDCRKRENIKLRNSPQLLSDFISLLYSSIWGYSLNIPFPKVPNYPSPIKYAEHYATWQYGILTDNDTSLNDLGIDVDNAKPKICKIVQSNNNNNENDINMLG